MTWDYRCPFARNAHEHLLDALAGGAPWDVTFVPFSLAQVHVAEGQSDVWDRPDDDSGLLALQVGTVVRDIAPDRFPAVHRALFALRHDLGEHISDAGALRRVLDDNGVDADAVFADIETGNPLATVRREHTSAAREHQVWGVPTFIHDGSAVFVRLMERPHGDFTYAQLTIQRVLDLLSEAPILNEFKHTALAR